MQTLRRFTSIVWLSCALLVPAAGAMAQHFASKNGYQITAPPGWKLNTTGMFGADSIMFLPPVGGFAPNINVVVVAAKPGESLSAAGPQLTAEFGQQFTAFHQISQSISTFEGHPSLRTVGTYERGSASAPMRMDQIIVVGPRRDFVFTLTADNAHQAQYEAGFAQAMRSVKIVRP